MPSRQAPRLVFTLSASGAPRSAHEQASQAWVAQRLASITGWAFGGQYHPEHAEGARPYFVPDDTLTASQAANLGISGEEDLFGGVVPHGFVASKVITHGLPTMDAHAPAGWQHDLATSLDAAVLRGFTVFDTAAIAPAARQLLAGGGTIRLKEAQARGGNGQHLVEDARALDGIITTLDPNTVRRHGVVLEQHLERATTCSVGQIHAGGLRLAYIGTQHQVRARDGSEVYGGSSLRILQGGLDALEPVAREGAEREALRHARRYDAAVSAAYPGFYASRRNYDVVAGHDAQGRWRCGVLEQSWRMGGASPAEIVALEAFQRPDAAPLLEVSCHESHDPAQVAPPGAQVHFHDPSVTHGPVLKYARVEGSHGNPA